MEFIWIDDHERLPKESDTCTHTLSHTQTQTQTLTHAHAHAHTHIPHTHIQPELYADGWIDP